MTQTEKYKLNLLDGEDKLSPRPLNENMEKVEAAMLGLAASHVSEVGKRVVMARGSYVGTGTGKVSIETPGFTPVAMAIWRKDVTAQYVEKNLVYGSFPNNPASFWAGEDIKGVTSARFDGVYDTTTKFTIEFTPREGGLSWEVKFDDTTGLSSWDVPTGYAFDHHTGTYCWVAFGYAEVDHGGEA